MKVVVFVGPTISPDDVGRELPAECRGPVAQGDVYHAALEQPVAIGIVDGYFERVPAVWHKEILWAMSQGVHVFGSASMGALRAAELAPFGMRGVGAIFEAFRDGALEDDDEVAVAHASAEHGFRAGSDAMVNIRATVDHARQSGVITERTARGLTDIAKTLFYVERSYASVLDLAAGTVDPHELLRFSDWLPSGRIDQKRVDAVAMLGEMRRFLAPRPEPMRASYAFEESLHWEALRFDVRPGTRSRPDALVLEALRRDPGRLARAIEGALGWWLATRQAWREGQVPAAADVMESSAVFCRTHGLSTPQAVERWLESNHATVRDLDRLLVGVAHLTRAIAGAGPELEAVLLDYLRWTGDYERLLINEPSRAADRP
jgi:hypothetical protein